MSHDQVSCSIRALSLNQDFWIIICTIFLFLLISYTGSYLSLLYSVPGLSVVWYSRNQFIASVSCYKVFVLGHSQFMIYSVSSYILSTANWHSWPIYIQKISRNPERILFIQSWNISYLVQLAILNTPLPVKRGNLVVITLSASVSFEVTSNTIQPSHRKDLPRNRSYSVYGKSRRDIQQKWRDRKLFLVLLL